MARDFRVILVGHALSPYRGSEPGNTWNWAWYLSHHLPVDLVAFPQYREEVEAFLAQHPNPRLRVHWVTLSGWDPWDPARGERGIRLHYILWLGKAYRLVKNLASEARSPVLAHHVSWNTVSAPPPPLPGFPLVWGPVGGGMRAPGAFRALFGRDWPKEVLRSLRVALLPWWPGWRSKVAGVSLALATNRETLELLRRGGARRTELFLDTGVPPGFGLGAPPHAPREPGPLRLLWAGRFEPIKALPLALRALRWVRTPVELWVAGGGPLEGLWQEEARRLGLEDRIRFLGRLPWEKMREAFLGAHALVFTSLRDSSGAVVWEAMAHGLPVVTLDHQGVGTFLPEAAAIKVPVTTPEDTVRLLAKAIDQLAADEALRLRMAQAAWRYAQAERWDRRAERMLTLYEEVLSHAHRRV